MEPAALGPHSCMLFSSASSPPHSQLTHTNHTLHAPMPSQPDVKEVRSAALAVQVAMSRLHVRNSGRSISMAKLMEAFEVGGFVAVGK